ncbi:MAG: universal stress protein [Desulfobacteraceae bacterium]|nr:universal stress protein [Desulfobacteraceae bacterium]
MKIMVAYDGSEIAQRALMIAQKRAKSMQAELHIFTSAANTNGKGDDAQNAKLQEAQRDCEMLCKAANVVCKVEMSKFNLAVAEDIVRYARENQIDEIVIGLRRRSQLGKLLFGSTSRQVILDAPCPVLSVK